MDNNTNTPTTNLAGGTEPVVTNAAAPAQPGNTPATAGTVDIDAIAAKAAEQSEKKAQAVFRSMLEQQGVDTATIKQMTEDWKSKHDLQFAVSCLRHHPGKGAAKSDGRDDAQLCVCANR